MWNIYLIAFKAKGKLNVFYDLFIKVNADTNALFVCGELVLMTQLLLKAFLDQCDICSFHSIEIKKKDAETKTHVVKEHYASWLRRKIALSAKLPCFFGSDSFVIPSY